MRCAKCQEWCKKKGAILCRYCWKSCDDSPDVEIERPITVKRETPRERA